MTRKHKSIKKQKVVITDHAIVRYFERVLGINMDEVRYRILPPVFHEFVENSPNLKSMTVVGEVGEHVIKVINGTITTIYLPGKMARRNDN